MKWLFGEVLNKKTLGTLETTPSISHETLEVQGYPCPIFFVTELEARSWKDAKRNAGSAESGLDDLWKPEAPLGDDRDIWPLTVTLIG